MFPRVRSILLGFLCSSACALSHRAGASPCPPSTAPLVSRAWAAYRADSITTAVGYFMAAGRICPGHMDVVVGLGFSFLRLGRTHEADSLFRVAVARDSANPDGWEGLALASSRLGDHRSAIQAARRLLEIVPGHSTARGVLDAEQPGWDLAPRAPRIRPDTLEMPARTRGEHFEIRYRDGWQPLYVKGINLGVALPGRFPGEFPPDSALYAGWLELIAGMNANAVRVYTILPPAFYRALRDWNLRHPDRRLWLIHGVWAELPPADDFDDVAWKQEFRAEMKRVVDVIHGACDLPRRPGHASGRYGADVSPWTLAYIIGREWEPYAIQHFDAGKPLAGGWRGRFLEVKGGTPSEVWMAEQCDHMLGLESDGFHALRPIAFTSWPTLDPLHHPTESNAGEEDTWRQLVGRKTSHNQLEYDNDAVSLDASRVHSTAANPCGWFASYHAYPYYPDFMLYDPGYNRARSSEGRSNYFGYLEELHHHHAGIPLLIAEYGVPSSRGLAHFQPQGWDHGGHDQRQMAAIDARLTREIKESGAAGGILFEWIDEWFKKNWVVVDLEIPSENTRRWHNAMDAEQNYGVLGMIAGDSATTPEPGGDPVRWLALPELQSRTDGAPWSPRALRVGSDAAFVYLAIELSGSGTRTLPWDSLGIAVALDTWDPERGQFCLPGLVDRSEVGFEYLADLSGPEASELRVTPDYNPYTGFRDPQHQDDCGAFYHRPVTSLPRSDGRFDSLFVLVNRARFARDGTYFPARGSDRGRLVFGAARESSLSDWYYDATARLIELRLPWGLLNVSDPSSRRILFETRADQDFSTVESDGFRIGVVTYRKHGIPRALGALPPLNREGRWARAQFHSWEWAPWSEPRYHAMLKPVYEALREAWSDSSEASRSALAPAPDEPGAR